MGIRLGHITAVTIDMAHLDAPTRLSYGFQPVPRTLLGNNPSLLLGNILQPTQLAPAVSRTAFRNAVTPSTGRYLSDRIASSPFKSVSLPASINEVCELLEQSAPDVVSGKQDRRSYLAPLLKHPHLTSIMENLYYAEGVGEARNLLEVYWPELKYRYVTQDPEHHEDRTVQHEMFHLLRKAEEYIESMRDTDPEFFEEFRDVLRFSLLFLCYGKHDGQEVDDDGRVVAVQEGARRTLPNGKVGFTGYHSRFSCFEHLMHLLNGEAALNKEAITLVSYLIENHFAPISFIRGARGDFSNKTAKKFLKDFCYEKSEVLKLGIPPQTLIKLLKHTVMIHQYGTDPRHTDEKAQFRGTLERFFNEMERQIPDVEAQVTRDIFEQRSPFVRDIRRAVSDFVQEKVGQAEMKRVFNGVRDHVFALCQEGQVTTVAQALSAAEDYLILMFPDLTPMSGDRRNELLSSVRPQSSSMRLSVTSALEITSQQGTVCTVKHYAINPITDQFNHHDPEVMRAQVNSGRYPHLARAVAADTLSVEKIIEAMTTKGFLNLTDLDLWIAEAERPSVCIDIVGHGAGATFPYVTIERKAPDGTTLTITMRRGFQGSVEHIGEGWTHSIAQRGLDMGSELRRTDDPQAKLGQVSDDIGVGVLTSDFVLIPADAPGRSFAFGRTASRRFGLVLVDHISPTEWRVRTMMPVGGKKGLRERLKSQLGRLVGKLAQTNEAAAARSHADFQSALEAANAFLVRERVSHLLTIDEIPLKIRNPLNPVVIKDFIKERLQKFSLEQGLTPGALSKILDPLFNFVSSRTSQYIDARNMIVEQDGAFSEEITRLAEPIIKNAKAKKAAKENAIVSEDEIRTLLLGRSDLSRQFIGRALKEICKKMKDGSLQTREAIIDFANSIQYTQA